MIPHEAAFSTCRFSDNPSPSIDSLPPLDTSRHLHEDEEGADKITMTTPDRRLTIRTVACFGQCALAPVVEIDHAIRGHVKEQALIREVETLRKESGR